MIISKEDIEAFSKLYRINLINSISGYKSANLIGTVDQQGNCNLAVFSSVIHLGSSPALLGFILRPPTVPRHTYDNIVSTGYFIVNHVNQSISEAAHRTSAKYGKDQDEFEIVGLNKEYSDHFPSPFVKESHIKVGLKFVEKLSIKTNGTLMIIGEIIELRIDEDLLKEDGYVDLSMADTVAINGLDGYLKPQSPTRFSYARPDKTVEIIK